MTQAAGYSRLLQQVCDLIEQADALLIAAGAGMGVDSGLPDFRGRQGFWNAYPVFRELGYSFVDMANPAWFSERPKLAWAFYGHRLSLYRKTMPHMGYQLLLRLIERYGFDYFIFTSNVDGQFEKAGFDKRAIIECHGSIHYQQCHYACNEQVWLAGSDVLIDMDEFMAQDPLPVCPHCERIARPNILMFNDWEWNAARMQLQQSRFNRWLDRQYAKKLLILEYGAGTAVPTVRRTCESLAERFNTQLVRINPNEADEFERAISVPLGAKTATQAIYELL